MSDEMVREYLQRDRQRGFWMGLVNPFTSLDGAAALALGLVFVAATGAVAVIGRVAYDGIMDVHAGISAPTVALALMPLLDWLVVALLFWLAGVLMSRGGVRILDCFAMSALGRLPFLFVGLIWAEQALGRYLPSLVRVMQSAPDPTALVSQPFFLLVMAGGILTMILMLWGLFLNFFAMREATGVETQRAIPAYMGIIIIGEIISKLLVGLLLRVV